MEKGASEITAFHELGGPQRKLMISLAEGKKSY